VNWVTVRAWLATAVRILLGVVWIWAAWEKLQSPRTFVQAVRAYDMTWEWLAKAIGYGLPVLEFCLGIVLILGVATRLAAAVSAALFLVFLVGIVQAAARGLQLDCGCFGGGGVTTGETRYTLDILRDIGLLILAGYLVVWHVSRVSIDAALARNDYVEPPSAKRMRSEQGKRKYNAMVETRRKQARDRALYVNGSLALVIALVALIGIGVQSGRAKIEGSLVAVNASVDNGVVYGTKAAATVDIYEDFMCPFCEKFEQSAGPALVQAVKDNRAQVRYHPLSFLDRASNGTKYSTRAANAAICASDISVDFFVKYHGVLYGDDKDGNKVQPAEGSNGRSDAELIGYAKQAGIPADKETDFGTCVQTQRHVGLVQAITDKATQKGITATPTVLVNGKKVDATAAAVQKAITEAAKNGPAPTPSPSSSPAPRVTPSVTPPASVAPSPTATP
jgi:protein-disulfide isomerase